MSTDLYLYTESKEIASIDWLRNPFGLCQWAEDNFGEEGLLTMVTNQWAYDKCEEIDRRLFKQVVDDYWARINIHATSYFWFNEAQYQRFIKPYEVHFLGYIAFSGIAGTIQTVDNKKGIPIGYFDKDNLPDSLSLKRRRQGNTIKEMYLNWFAELVDFANKLQNKEYRFYCEN